jgi:DNA-binding NtrC family response regulator
MSPSLNSEVIPLSEVPLPQDSDLFDTTTDTELRPPVVLVVDDEPLVADSLSAILNYAGYSTLTAYDGPTALNLASVMAPELLISDVAMPRMNGVQLAVAMVQAVPTCKVILFSGHATSADLVYAVRAGHDFPLISKPIHPTDMLKQIARRLSHATHRVRPQRRTNMLPLANMLETA